MAKIGCIVMYSKPIEKNKTIPYGTVFYEDGTEEEISLKEAAEKALLMSLENGYENALNNERYFNTTYDEFINEKEKYREIVKNINNTTDVSKPIVTKIEEDYRKKLPDGIKEVEPPKVIKAEPKEPVSTEEEVIDNKIEKQEEDSINFSKIEEKINEILEKELNDENNQNNFSQNDLEKMINEQNKRVEEENINKR